MNNKKALQLEELEILKFIKSFCEKNNIRFYMQGGTFLGAIRHKGFIPWDDDADIGIPRKDYERFVELMKTNDDDRYEITTYKDENSDYNYICKVHSKKIMVKETNYSNDRTYGIWVDVFPLDGMPNNRIIRKIHKYRLLYHRAMWKLSDESNISKSNNRKSFIDKVIIFLGTKLKIGKIFNKKKEIFKINKLLKKFDYDKSINVVNFMGAYKFREMFNRRIYDEKSNYEFENIQLPGPKDYDFYLTQMYGDYMTPPKKELQDVHSLEIVKGEK